MEGWRGGGKRKEAMEPKVMRPMLREIRGRRVCGQGEGGVNSFGNM